MTDTISNLWHASAVTPMTVLRNKYEFSDDEFSTFLGCPIGDPKARINYSITYYDEGGDKCAATDPDAFPMTTLDVLYTDGDGGLMEFSRGTDIFEDDGVTVRTIECAYAEISIDAMAYISDLFEDPTQVTHKDIIEL
jgi:hypothetical protein